jgi:hypothetical protein
MLRTGLTAAGLVLAAVALVTGGRAGAQPTHVRHTCTATDKQFIRAAALSSMTLMMLGQDFGGSSPKEALAETRQADLSVGNTHPNDSSLKLVQTLLHGMLVEYRRAIRAQANGGDSGTHMYRSYSFANYGHQVLVAAAPALDQLGCSVSDLLQE